jgi:hypothetical protein
VASAPAASTTWRPADDAALAQAQGDVPRGDLAVDRRRNRAAGRQIPDVNLRHAGFEDEHLVAGFGQLEGHDAAPETGAHYDDVPSCGWPGRASCPPDRRRRRVVRCTRRNDTTGKEVGKSLNARHPA